MTVFTILTNKKEVLREFDRWLAAIEEHEDTGRVEFSRFQEQKAEPHVNFWIADSGNSVVQINAPTNPATENGLSAIAVSQDGRRCLLRQGWLKKNLVNPHDVREDYFADHFPEARLEVTIAGGQAKRAWYLVTWLDLDPKDIAWNTCRFVEHCWTLRQSLQETREQEAASELGPDPSRERDDSETGGEFFYRTLEELRKGIRRQGFVWEHLKARAMASGHKLSKPKGLGQHQVDAVLEMAGIPGGASRRILIEIKSFNTPADIYAGVGQLFLYPSLITGLEDPKIEKVLLVPEEVAPELVKAAKMHAITVLTFTQNGDGGEVAFSSACTDFLRLV